MPIRIYNNSETLTYLCEDIWDLPDQIDALESWLEEKAKDLPKSSYVADIGFNIREDATGGGGMLKSKSMEIMGQIGMDIYFSEYP